MSYVRMTQIVDELAERETARIRLGKGRFQAMMEAIEVIEPLFANAPHGVMGLTPAFIAAPDASYLIIDLASGTGNALHFGQLTLTTVDLVTIGGELFVRNVDNGAILGAMNEVATTRYVARPNAWLDQAHPLRQAAYEGLVYASPANGCSLLHTRFALPLSGPALRHPAFQRMVDFAKSVLADEQPELKVLKGFDAALRTVSEPLVALEAEVAALMTVASNRYDPHAWDADLVTLMQRHDWSWHVSDDLAEQAAEDQQVISGRLNALPLEVAMAFLGSAGHRGHAWRPALRILMDQPEVLPLAA